MIRPESNKYYPWYSRYGNYHVTTFIASGRWWPLTVNNVIASQRRRRHR